MGYCYCGRFLGDLGFYIPDLSPQHLVSQGQEQYWEGYILMVCVSDQYCFINSLI